MPLKRFFLLLLGLTLVACIVVNQPVASIGQTEILWDKWGVPHIYGKNSEELFKAFGWAQTQSHGNLILRLYGQARGRAAEYWGASYLSSDRYVRMMGIPARAQQWYDGQDKQIQGYLNAFAAGINDYAQKHPSEIDDPLKAVLPITGVDILAHVQRVIHFHFLSDPRQIASLKTSPTQGGSNAWAIAPTHSASSNAMLLANPHLPWTDLFLWYEAQLSAPNIDAYGATLVGMPVLAIAFNNDLGWTVTVNPIDGADIYQLTLKDDGYLLDGEVRPFERESQTIKIRQSNGKFIEEQFQIERSIQGTVITKQNDKAFALRVAGLDRPNGVKQLWQMATAKNLQEFEAAVQPLQIPLFNIIYGDRRGHILYVFNGQVPVRNTGDWNYWQGIIPGDTSKTLWTKYLDYKDLPRLLDPANGWLQNTNDPPWTSTFPSLLDPKKYPAYLAPASLGEASDIFRSQRSIQLLQESEKLSFEQMCDRKFSSRLELADRILEYLIPAARLLSNPIGLEAAQVLKDWDRQTNADSKGAVLFTLWAKTIQTSKLFSRPWNDKEALSTPTGLADVNNALAILEGVAAQVKLLYGSLDVSWGEVVRLRYGKQDLPASGAPGSLGSFRVLDLVSTKDERFQVVSGDSYIAAIEFSNPIKAKALTVYGNATQPNSSHVGDQLPLYSRGELRPVWRDRQEIEAHLESRQVFN
ncbi:acylase [Candidatus Gracilibacteria bacterium]|nr:acylase [Candidatus Gracilibacteria bacterium]NJM90046.1 acylase [Hydrococcus sp. RU_2_2]NJP20780.1 acylase [Hydrococcus sp. CRU_1_1]NJQ96617.1 acylase [Hydrococcus sp. CSU_1_8]